MIEFLSQPWPWYAAGPLIGLVVPILLLTGGKIFGISENLRHICAAVCPRQISYFQYDWWRAGSWNLTFVLGIVIGGFIAATFLSNPDPVAISVATRLDLTRLGISDFDELLPTSIFSWSGLLTPTGLILMVIGGFLVGFGSKYSGGCTSGHAIMGLAELQFPSFLAVIGFFSGGLFVTHVILPFIF